MIDVHARRLFDRAAVFAYFSRGIYIRVDAFLALRIIRGRRRCGSTGQRTGMYATALRHAVHHVRSSKRLLQQQRGGVDRIVYYDDAE